MFPSGNRIQTTGDAVLDAQALLEACEKRKPKSNMAIAQVLASCCSPMLLLYWMLDDFDLLKIVHVFFRPDAVLFEFAG